MAKKNIASKLKNIQCLLLDVDGVLTDGSIFFTPEDQEFKVFHALDGLGIVIAKASGLRVGFVTARNSKVVDKRGKELNLDIVIQGALNKNHVLSTVTRKFNLKNNAICYVGDDLIDIPILKKAGVAVAVSNAVPEVKRIADYVSKARGGSGAVREVVELILKAQGKWKNIVREFSQ